MHWSNQLGNLCCIRFWGINAYKGTVERICPIKGKEQKIFFSSVEAATELSFSYLKKNSN